MACMHPNTHRCVRVHTYHTCNFTHIYHTHTHTCICIHIYHTHAYMHLHTYLPYIHAYMHLHTYLPYIHAYMHLHTYSPYTRIHASTYLCTKHTCIPYTYLAILEHRYHTITVRLTIFCRWLRICCGLLQHSESVYVGRHRRRFHICRVSLGQCDTKPIISLQTWSIIVRLAAVRLVVLLSAWLMFLSSLRYGSDLYSTLDTGSERYS